MYKLWLLLLVLAPIVSYSQTSTSSDSACYSAKENEGITRGLLELQEVRGQIKPLLLAQGYYSSRNARVDSVLALYCRKRSFLGIGLRKSKRRLRAQINALP